MIDTHAHYDDKAFNNDRHELLAGMPLQGVEIIINNGDSIKTSRKSISLAEKYPFIYAAVGVHPHNATEFSDEIYEEIKKMASHKKTVAIGEIGLDYHYDFSPRSVQKDVFSKQLCLAREVELPVVIHEREACRDCLEILKAEAKDLNIVMHCFSGSVETLKIVLDMGFLISLGGTVTFKNAVKTAEVASFVPLDRLMLETDCPYLTPVPHRGKRNDSSYLPFVAERIAQIRGIKTEEVISATTENAKRFYNIT